ncbi:MAG TPA: PQQ-binding-like beta-propeller repeat protein [Pyrinomonadaceae bacterium]|nr:PQQ-binding-like beta-propeller repeat protein [Pyrinomonadaceae bacterium]
MNGAGEHQRAGSPLSRRSFLLSAVAVGLAPGAARASWNNYAAPADGWPQFRGNAQLTGFSNSGIPGNMRLLWTFDAGESIESSAAVAGGVVYVGTQRGELVALNLSDGGVRWRYAAGNAIGESSPAVSRGVVYVGDLGGVVHAVRAGDGQRAWAFKTGGEVKSSPVVAGGRVVVGSYDTHLYGLSAAAGRPVWKLKTNGQVHATAGVAEGVAYVAGCDELLRAVRLTDGRQLYEVRSGAYTGASAALLAGNAFYGTFNNEVLGVNLVARQIGWRYQHRERQFPFYSSAAVIDARVVVGGRDKMVHCLDAYTGRAHWTFATQARVESSPAVADGRVFFGSNDGRFYVLDFQRGHKLAEFNAGAPLSASPAVASGRVVIGSQDGKLYCFG